MGGVFASLSVCVCKDRKDLEGGGGGEGGGV